MPIPTSINGTNVNGSTAYRVVFPIDSPMDNAASLTLVPRENDTPLDTGFQVNERSVPFLVSPGTTGVPVSNEQWYQNAMGIFLPEGSKLSIRASWRSQTIELFGAVVSIGPLPGSPVNDEDDSIIAGEFVVPDPVWREIAAETADATSPLSVSRGNVKPQPTITFTPSTTTLRHRIITITDTLGIGLSNYPIIIAFDSTGISATTTANYIAFINEREIPIYTHNPNNASTRMLIRVNCDPSQSITCHIYYGSSVNNTVTAQALDPLGMAITDADLTNTHWIWDDFVLSSNPQNVSGVWTLLNTPEIGLHFPVYTEAAGSLAFQGSTPGTELNTTTPNAAVLILGGSLAGTTNALTGLSRQFTDVLGAPALGGFIKYQPFGTVSFTTAWQLAGDNTTVTTAADVDLAVLIYYGVYSNANTLNTVTFSVSGEFALDLTFTPTVNVGAATTARFVNSTLTNTTTGETIQFDNLYMDDTTLIVDCLNKTITSGNGTVFNRRGIRFSNKEKWFALAIGSNAWTNATNFSASFSWKPAYRI